MTEGDVDPKDTKRQSRVAQQAKEGMMLMLGGVDHDHQKKWKAQDILSKWKNELIIYAIDKTNAVKHIGLNNFVTENDYWGPRSDYLVYFGIR